MIYVMSGPTLHAIIAVTYPAGSVCTCGGKKANDTSGYAEDPNCAAFGVSKNA